MGATPRSRRCQAARVLAAAEQVAAPYGVAVVVASGPPPGTHERAVLRVWAGGTVRLELSTSDLDEVAAWLRALAQPSPPPAGGSARG
jgi:hypothetical protein